MKIVFLLHSYYKYSFGGAEYQVYLIAQYLLRKGYEIHYVFLGENRSYPKIDNGIKLHPVYKKRPLIYKLFGKSYLVFGNEINSILKNIDPDFIYHRNFSSIFLSAIKYSGRIKCKTILHIAHKCDVNKNCVNFGSNIIRNIYNRIVKNKCLKKVDYIIAQAKYQDELLRYNYNRKADLIMKNMHPYPNGKLVKSEQLKVLWISNLKEWKQPEKFIQLAKESEYTNAEFIMIGRDPKNEWSEGFKKRISEIKNLSYLGELPIKRVNEFLAESHILVNTSLYEGFPNTF
ncbi:MAG: glycosyltransferase family 4 protein, partial [Patescibacteria group bacterium]|nr:glycosyltransferase family 4 protein [Patescibacteria group bacterium]